MRPIRAAYLNLLGTVRVAKSMTRPILAAVTGIDPDYLTSIDQRKSEPYFHEAVLIARALCVDGLLPLITLGKLTDCDMDGRPSCDLGVPLPSDMAMLRGGIPMPLSLACRITVQLGLSDPVELAQPRPETMQQIWSIVASGERLWGIGGQAGCPWCREPVSAGAAHLPTCLPHNLYGARGRHLVAPGIITAPPLPMRPGKGRRASDFARNLRTLRERSGESAKDLSYRVGMLATYYSRIERLRLPLTLDKAKPLAGALGVEIALLYANEGTVGSEI